MRLLRHFFLITLIMVGVLLLMVLRDIINPPREFKPTLKPAFVIYPERETIEEIRARRAAEEDVNGPWHREQFETEVAFNLGIDTSEVAQEQFNERYSNPQN